MNHTTTASAPTASHTPGPWRVETFDGPRQYASIEAGSEVNDIIRVCDIPSWPAAIEEMEANARLIAAAPAMLAALLALVHPMASDKDVDHARAVIAAATASEQT